jgi:hypothetical protein
MEVVKIVSKDKARVEKIDTLYWIYFNELKYKQDSTIEVEIEVDIDSARVKPGCLSCTKARILGSVGNKHLLEINYDTTNIGDFTKTVTFFYTKNEVENSIVMKITGTVKR